MYAAYYTVGGGCGLYFCGYYDTVLDIKLIKYDFNYIGKLLLMLYTNDGQMFHINLISCVYFCCFIRLIKILLSMELLIYK